MKCNHADQLLMKYMDGILTMDEAKKLNYHITECVSCREEFFTYQIMMEELQEGKMVEAPEQFEFEVMDKIKGIDFDYKVKEIGSIENITAMLWGVFSLVFGIGVLLFIYRQPVLEYLLQSPYMGDWVKAVLPAVDLLSSQINDIRTEIEEFLSNGRQIITLLKVITISVLTMLASIQYYIYRKKKVEIS